MLIDNIVGTVKDFHLINLPIAKLSVEPSAFFRRVFHVVS